MSHTTARLPASPIWGASERPALPALRWWGAADNDIPVSQDTLTITAAPGTDWSNDALGAPSYHTAPALIFDAPPELTLSARVRVTTPRTTFDAGALVLWSDRDHWAKLCFEQSPQGQAMVVSTVTNEFTDDCNSWDVDGEEVFLRISRTGPAWAFHASADGVTWQFVRLFRLRTMLPVQMGFLAQAPMGDTCTAVFDQLGYDTRMPADLRDGS